MRRALDQSTIANWTWLEKSNAVARCAGDRVPAPRSPMGADDDHRHRHARRRRRWRPASRQAIRPTPAATSRPASSSATPTCTPAPRWMPAHSATGWARGSLSLRARRGDDRLQRRAREALAAARFPRRRGPLRQHGLLPRALRRQARDPRRSDRQALVRHDPEGRRGGRQGGARDHRQVLARHVPAGAAVPARLRRLSLGLGADHRRGREVQRARPLHRLHRLRVDLAGPARQQPASRRGLPRRRRQGDARPSRSRPIRRSAARPRRTSGSAAGLRGQDRRQRAGDRAQRQSLATA